MAAKTPTYRYRVDKADVVRWVDEWWLAFARENGAEELIEQSVVGRSLWDYVADSVTRQLYQEIHARVRKSGKPVDISFRCDSPSLQRHMRLRIICEEAGQLLYESLQVRANPQRHARVLDRTWPRSGAFLTMCSFCKRALLEPFGWLDVEDVSVRLRLFEASTMPELRYTICSECVRTMRDFPNNNHAA